MNYNKIINLEDAFYYLVDQIDYGDISNMDIYWDGMSSAILALSIKGLKKTSKSKPSNFSSLLKILPPRLIPNNFIEIIEDMESATDKSSDDTINPDELDELRELTEKVETLFNAFIKNLKGYKDE